MNRRNVVKGMAAAMAFAGADAGAHAEGPDTIYELRVYHAVEGKMDLLLGRFPQEVAIFKRCGMPGVGFWVPAEDGGPQGPGAIKAGQTLVYMLRHESRESARANWAKFRADPEFAALKAVSEKEGPIVAKADSTFLKLTDFSPKV